MSGGEAVQVIGAAGPVRLPILDLTALPVALREEEARRLTLGEASRPFDLGRGPLLRHSLIVLARVEHLALLNIHHIVSDAWSVGVLVRELGALYAAFTRGLPAPLPELEIQYADYACWQRRWLTAEAVAAQLVHWREELRGLPAALELPADRPRLAAQTFRGERTHFALPADLPGALRVLCRRQGTTLFMALMAGFQALLGRYSGQDDLAVGTPIAGRTDTRTEPLIGLFVNMLVVRGRLAGEPPFAAHLGAVRETMLRAYAHQDLPFERLVEELQIERDLSRTPLFQVVLALQNTPAEPLALPGLTLEPVP